MARTGLAAMLLVLLISACAALQTQPGQVAVDALAITAEIAEVRADIRAAGGPTVSAYSDADLARLQALRVRGETVLDVLDRRLAGARTVGGKALVLLTAKDQLWADARAIYTEARSIIAPHCADGSLSTARCASLARTDAAARSLAERIDAMQSAQPGSEQTQTLRDLLTLTALVAAR